MSAAKIEMIWKSSGSRMRECLTGLIICLFIIIFFVFITILIIFCLITKDKFLSNNKNNYLILFNI